MRKIITLFSVLFFIGACIFAVCMQVIIPDLAREKISTAIKSAGFDHASLPSGEVYFGAIQFNDVALDSLGINQIGTLFVSYDPINFLIFKRLNYIEITGLELTAEWLSSEQNLILDGWRNDAIAPATQIQASKIYIKDAAFSLLTPQWGGLNFASDILAKKDNGKFQIQYQIQSRQKEMSFSANGSAILAPNYWSAQGELERARLTLPQWDGRISRMSGKYQINQDQSNTVSALAELQSGGLEIYSSLWRDVKITIEKSNAPDWQIFAFGKSFNHEQNQTEISLSGDLTTPQAELYVGDDRHLIDFEELKNLMDYIPK